MLLAGGFACGFRRCGVLSVVVAVVVVVKRVGMFPLGGGPWVSGFRSRLTDWESRTKETASMLFAAGCLGVVLLNPGFDGMSFVFVVDRAAGFSLGDETGVSRSRSRLRGQDNARTNRVAFSGWRILCARCALQCRSARLWTLSSCALS